MAEIVFYLLTHPVPESQMDIKFSIKVISLLGFLEWMNSTLYKLTSLSSSPSLSTQIYTHHEEGNGRLKRGQSGTLLVIVPWSVNLYLPLMFCAQWLTTEQGAVLLMQKAQASLRTEATWVMCSCPFSDSSLDRKLPLRLPKWDLSV